MSIFSLKKVIVTTVKPARKIDHPSTIEPSAFDVITIDAYIPLVLFYKPDLEGGCDSYDQLVEHLKESLSKVLVPFFPFAGRWVRTYDASIRKLQCTDEGVPFIKALIDEELSTVVKIDDFEALEILGGFQLVGLDPTVFSQDVHFPLPPLFIQVTEFKCGGVAVHAAFSHQTTDGQGMQTFMKAWSQTCLDGQLPRRVPVHDRSLTMSLKGILEFYGARVALEDENEACPEQVGDTTGAKPTLVDPGALLRFAQQEPMSHKTLHVRREVIEGLKRDAAENNVVTTTVDLISAHIWRSVNNLPAAIDNKTSTVLGTWVDGRRRFHNPPLPADYCGNAVLLAFTPLIPATELSSKSILFAAGVIQNTVKAINPSTWQESIVNLFYFLESFHEHDYRQIMITSWFRFPMYEINFGHGFGTPIYACLNISNRFLPLGMVVIFPPRPGLPVDAIATVQLLVQKSNGASQALLTDPHFLSFFH